MASNKGEEAAKINLWANIFLSPTRKTTSASLSFSANRPKTS